VHQYKDMLTLYRVPDLQSRHLLRKTVLVKYIQLDTFSRINSRCHETWP